MLWKDYPVYYYSSVILFEWFKFTTTNKQSIIEPHPPLPTVGPWGALKDDVGSDTEAQRLSELFAGELIDIGPQPHVYAQKREGGGGLMGVGPEGAGNQKESGWSEKINWRREGGGKTEWGEITGPVHADWVGKSGGDKECWEGKGYWGSEVWGGRDRGNTVVGWGAAIEKQMGVTNFQWVFFNQNKPLNLLFNHTTLSEGSKEGMHQPAGSSNFDITMMKRPSRQLLLHQIDLS